MLLGSSHDTNQDLRPSFAFDLDGRRRPDPPPNCFGGKPNLQQNLFFGLVKGLKVLRLYDVHSALHLALCRNNVHGLRWAHCRDT